VNHAGYSVIKELGPQYGAAVAWPARWESDRRSGLNRTIITLYQWDSLSIHVFVNAHICMQVLVATNSIGCVSAKLIHIRFGDYNLQVYPVS
jgi:hypothetical protein